MSPETKLGLFVFGGLIILLISVIFLGDIHLQKGYEVNILFDDIAGLPEKALVKISGVEVGRVSEIDLKGRRAEVVAWIEQNIKIHKDCKARIIPTGIIGTKYLEMTLGSEDEPLLKDGDTILGVEPISYDEVINKLMAGVDRLGETIESFGIEKGFGEDLRDAIENIKEISQKINLAIGPEEELRDTVKNFGEFSDNVRKLAKNLNQVVEENRENLKKTLGGLSTISDDLKEAFDSISTVAKKIEEGEGVLGKLITDEEMAEDLKDSFENVRKASHEAERVLARISGFTTAWDYQLHYNADDEKFRSDFGIKIIPKPGKFYYFAVNNIAEKDGGDYDEGDQKINSFTAGIGKSFGPLTLYGGIIRSSGGVGVGFRPFGKEWFELFTEAFRFDRDVDNKDKAWINAGGKFKVTEWLYLKANAEDILERKSFNTTLNLSIEDEDMAYLLGLAGLSSATKR